MISMLQCCLAICFVLIRRKVNTFFYKSTKHIFTNGLKVLYIILHSANFKVNHNEEAKSIVYHIFI